jgi:hypothetical protein
MRGEMTFAVDAYSDFPPIIPGRPLRKASSKGFVGSVTIALGLLTCAGVLYVRTGGVSDDVAKRDPIRATKVAAARPVQAPRYEPLLDSNYVLGPVPVPFDRQSPLASAFYVAPQASVSVAVEQPARPLLPSPDPLPALVAQSEDLVPLPMPRPATAQPKAPESVVRAPERVAQTKGQDAKAAVASATPNTPSFFEKVFGGEPQPRQALAYAAPEDEAFGFMHKFRASPALPQQPQTAVYDISAHVVYLPNGTRLEAHSGLGEMLDDPRSVHQRNRGATPPHVYDLTLREQLFHGVQALRLNPVGEGGIYGRTGLLAHTFMLGPSGASNGCVSFRNYNAFLQAYRNGEVRRLLVVAHL